MQRAIAVFLNRGPGRPMIVLSNTGLLSCCSLGRYRVAGNKKEAIGKKIAKVIFSLTTFAPAAASAASVKSGDYTIEMQRDEAVFKSGKNIESPAVNAIVEVPAIVFGAESGK